VKTLLLWRRITKRQWQWEQNSWVDRKDDRKE
jgi:hypothetical protein